MTGIRPPRTAGIAGPGAVQSAYEQRHPNPDAMRLTPSQFSSPCTRVAAPTAAAPG